MAKNQTKGREEMKVDSVSSMSPAPAKKRKTSATTKKKPTPTLMSLPYELLLSCLARVSRLYYPTLSLVSKRFRSLLASPELYKVRSLSGHTESCLYVCLGSYMDTPLESCWYTLCRKPGKEEKGYVLARVPIPSSPLAYFSDLVVAGSSIYHIVRSLSGLPASVSILDCRSHTWREAPSMRVGLISFSASVLDGKIYVAGIRRDGDSGSPKNTIEVFHTETETWDPEPIPCSEIHHGFYYRTTCIGGKYYVVHSPNGNVVAYSSKEGGRWDMVEWRNLRACLGSSSYCEIGNVLYSVNNGVFRWCDTEVSLWTKLKGLVGLPEFPPEEAPTCVRLADYGGKMAVSWNKRSPNYAYTRTLMIWCAVIALERCESCEIWGQVEWCGHVLTTYYELEKVLAVNV